MRGVHLYAAQSSCETKFLDSSMTKRQLLLTNSNPPDMGVGQGP